MLKLCAKGNCLCRYSEGKQGKRRSENRAITKLFRQHSAVRDSHQFLSIRCCTDLTYRLPDRIHPLQFHNNITIISNHKKLLTIDKLTSYTKLTLQKLQSRILPSREARSTLISTPATFMIQ